MPLPQTIHSAAFCKRLNDGEPMTILDVRTVLEHKGAHLCCMHDHVALDQLDVDKWLGAHPQAKQGPVYVLCASGKRATKAAEFLNKKGVNAVVVEGGLNACVADGAKTQGKKTITLERQVRIAAGAFVLTSALLTWFVHPAFVFLSVAVGAGLIFAGVTDRCGLALLLAHAPWNRDPGDAARASLQAFEQKRGV